MHLFSAMVSTASKDSVKPELDERDRDCEINHGLIELSTYYKEASLKTTTLEKLLQGSNPTGYKSE